MLQRCYKVRKLLFFLLNIFQIFEKCDFKEFPHKCGAGSVLSLVFSEARFHTTLGLPLPERYHEIHATVRLQDTEYSCFQQCSEKTSEWENKPKSSVLDQKNLLTV